MNKLTSLRKMGFKISWKLIDIGLSGAEEIPPVLTHSDLIEYLNSSLTDINDQTDNAIILICEKDDYSKFYNFFKKLVGKDSSNVELQKRKWRAYLLKDLLNNIDGDYLQGLLELMEFWLSMGNCDDCPQTFPNSNDKESIQNYFTQKSYELNLKANYSWLDTEITNIINLEF